MKFIFVMYSSLHCLREKGRKYSLLWLFISGQYVQYLKYLPPIIHVSLHMTPFTVFIDLIALMPVYTTDSLEYDNISY
jgi:hypothetical protein